MNPGSQVCTDSLLRKAMYLAAAFLGVSLTAPASAHHSIFGSFDGKTRIEITGTIIGYEWVNPHVKLLIRVANAEGADGEWLIETRGAADLQKHGWGRDSLSAGDEVIARGAQARDGSRHLYVNTISLTSGRTLFVGQDRFDRPKLPRLAVPEIDVQQHHDCTGAEDRL